MEFGVTQNRFEPSLSDSQTEAFIHGQRNLSVIPLNPYTAPPSTYIHFSILLISQSSFIIELNALTSYNSNVLPVFGK